MATWLIGTGSVLLIALWVVGLVDLFRQRQKMETWQLVVWAALIILVPLIGLVTYLFWRISRSEAMDDALSVQRNDSDPGSRPPINPTRR
ncbi:MAG: PLD nuclease N-terminal domain-containing protein [Actinomycetota bacterium]|nr:PLD nuclease N-terminal domain-containing protein [Actinomycetota bacterium]